MDDLHDYREGYCACGAREPESEDDLAATMRRLELVRDGRGADAYLEAEYEDRQNGGLDL